MKKMLSIIVPCYNEEKVLNIFYNECEKEIINLDLNVEYLFINDGSKDKTLDVIKNLYKKDKKVRYISFSRNFGKEAALYAGLKNCKGELAVVMDADLQDPPYLLKEMHQKILEGYDVVATKRVTRKGEPIIRSWFAKKFYRLINRLSKTEMVDGARDYRMMKRQVVDAVLEFGEYNRYSKGLFSFVGFDTYWISYENIERAAGNTKWSFWGLFKYATEGIIAFSTKPLLLSVIFGIIFCFVSFIFVIVIILKTLIWGDPVSGWPSLVCILLAISGIQLFCSGISGLYLAKTYMETKNRPIYIVKETEKK